MADAGNENLDLPKAVKEFFHKFNTFYVDKKQKTKISGSCKKCGKKITGDWKPQTVTSNFISHAKVGDNLVYIVTFFVYRLFTIHYK